MEQIYQRDQEPAQGEWLVDHAALVSVRGEPWTDSRNMTFKSGLRKMPEKELQVEEENEARDNEANREFKKGELNNITSFKEMKELAFSRRRGIFLWRRQDEWTSEQIWAEMQ